MTGAMPQAQAQVRGTASLQGLEWTTAPKRKRGGAVPLRPLQRLRKRPRLLLATAPYVRSARKPLEALVRPHVLREPLSRTLLAFDPFMMRHTDGPHTRHPERPERVLCIWNRIVQAGLAQHCERVPTRLSSASEALEAHTADHVRGVLGIEAGRRYPLEDRDCYTNEWTTACAQMAAAAVIDVTLDVCRGRKRNGFAIVRPPGHHATREAAMGFCFLNNIAMAARAALREPGVGRVLIVDWDVHHGNGTEAIFYDDPAVLCFSVHMFGEADYYPGTGHRQRLGSGPGTGYNVNVPWPCFGVGDAEYAALWAAVLRPLATAFQPDLVLVSAGFDSAAGDPLGQMDLSPHGFQALLRPLMDLPSAGGRVVLALEGGYNLTSIALAAEACLATLMGAPPGAPDGGAPPSPAPSAPGVAAPCAAVIAGVIDTLRPFWPDAFPLAAPAPAPAPAPVPAPCGAGSPGPTAAPTDTTPSASPSAAAP